MLDLRKVTFIDSTGIRLVLTEVKKDGIEFAVSPGPGQVQRIFELTGLLEYVPFISSTVAPASGQSASA